jgi:hypothetical protein
LTPRFSGWGGIFGSFLIFRLKGQFCQILGAFLRLFGFGGIFWVFSPYSLPVDFLGAFLRLFDFGGFFWVFWLKLAFLFFLGKNVRCKLKKACGSLTENKNFVFWFFYKNLELLTNIYIIWANYSTNIVLREFLT